MKKCFKKTSTQNGYNGWNIYIFMNLKKIWLLAKQSKQHTIATRWKMTLKVLYAILFYCSCSDSNKKAEMLRNVLIFIKYYLIYKNVSSENQSQEWEWSNFCMILLLCTLQRTHKTLCLKIKYSFWTILWIPNHQIYHHVTFLYFPNWRNALWTPFLLPFHTRFSVVSVSEWYTSFGLKSCISHQDKKT